MTFGLPPRLGQSEVEAISIQTSERGTSNVVYPIKRPKNQNLTVRFERSLVRSPVGEFIAVCSIFQLKTEIKRSIRI